MSALFSVLTWWERAAAILALAGALIGFGFVKGLQHGQEKLDAMVGKAAVETVRIARARDVVTTKVETKYLPALTKTEVITETILKEIPVHVPPDAAACSGYFRVYHDAAAEGRVPDTAGIADAAPVPAQDAAATVTENYGQCRKDQLKLQGLQEWINEQKKVRVASP